MTDSAKAKVTTGKYMKPEARRAQLIEVAEELFNKNGFNQVTMEGLASAASITKPIVYRHFPSKIDLYVEVLNNRAKSLTANMEIALSPISEPQEGDLDTAGLDLIGSVIRCYVEHAFNSGVDALTVFTNEGAEDERVKAALAAPHEEIAKMFASSLLEITELSEEEAAIVAETSCALAQAAASQALKSYKGFESETVRKIISVNSHFAWHGISNMLRLETNDLPAEGSDLDNS